MAISRTDNQNTQTQSERWEAALREKNISQLKKLLKNGFIPTDLQFEIEVDGITKSLIDILLENNIHGEDILCFDAADKLLVEGAKLPKPYREEKSFSTKEKYFKHLTFCDHDLYITLHNHPNIIHEKDKKQQTLLHHAAKLGLTLDSNKAGLVHYLLFNMPQIDFNVKDENGDTPLHVAAKNSKELVTCKYIFPNFLKAAKNAKFDFETLNHEGHTILHIAARVSYEDQFTGRINNIEQVLRWVADIPLNTLSSSGTTALYYTINHLHLPETRTLLEAGADPTIFGKDTEGNERNPLHMIEQHIKRLEGQIKSQEKKGDSAEQSYLCSLQNKLIDLKTIIEKKIRGDSCPKRCIFWFSQMFYRNSSETYHELAENLSPHKSKI
jgi:hypothetical protein